MSIAEKLTQIAENEQAVYEAGKDTERKAFWGAFQNYGNPRSYKQCFMLAGGDNMAWNAESFKPVYTFNATNAYQMFYTFGLSEIPVPIDITAASSTDYMFDNSGALVTISELIVSESTVFTTTTFRWCGRLANLKITGTVGTTLNLQYSPLSKASIESVINALSDTVEGKTLTLKATAKTAAFTDDEWAALIGTKPNWTISLV